MNFRTWLSRASEAGHHRDQPLTPAVVSGQRRERLRPGVVALPPTALSMGLGCLVAATAVAQEPVHIGSHPELIIASQQEWGELGLNVAADQADKEGQTLRIGDRTYTSGLGHHANGAITILLDQQYAAFDAELGVQPCEGGTVVFRIVADGRQLFESARIRSGDAPVPVHVEVKGAQELRLEAQDAGDGITCDVANWAEARLVPAPGASKQQLAQPAVDMARFARVVAWDPNRGFGAQANRVEEFRADDVFTETELKADGLGFADVPVSTNGLGCIGLQWLNRRNLRELSLELQAGNGLPASADVRVEGWFGESAWQGSWKPLDGDLQIEGPRLVFRLSSRKGVVQTSKVRWILPSLPSRLQARLTAFTRSSWAKTNIFIQLEKPGRGAKVSLWNGEPVESAGGARPDSEVTWRLGRQTQLAIRYSRPSSLNSDPTLLQFHLPKGDVSVAIADVLNNDCVYLPDYGLFVARVPLPVTLDEYRRRIAGRKSVLDEVRSMPDQTLAQSMARTHHDFQREGPVMLSLACDNAKFVVGRDGTVQFHPTPFEWLGMYRQVDWQPWYAGGCELKPRLGTGEGGEVTRHLDGGWLPIPVIEITRNGIHYTQRNFVAPYAQARPSDNVGRAKSVCVIEFTARNEASVAADARLQIGFLANVNPRQPAELVLSGQRVLVNGSGTPIAVIDLAGSDALQADLKEGELSWSRRLSPGEEARLTVYLPGEGVTSEEVASLRGAPELRAAAESYWKELLKDSLTVQTPDKFLDQVILSSQVRCLIDSRSEAGGSRVGASIAAMSYGPLESEAHSVIRGMDFMGHPEFARRSLDFFVHRYTTNGFLTTGYTTFGTAWHLWTLGEHYQLTRDAAWLKQIAPEVARACDWIVRQTGKTKRLDPSGHPVPEFGLMPPGVLADWNSFAYHFAMNAYYAAALREAGLALADIGHPDARQFVKRGEELREQTLRAYAWTQARAPALALRNGTWIPHYPSQVHSPGKLAEFFPGQDAGRSWCYDVEIGAHQLVPTGVLAPRGREVERIVDHMEDVQFLADGWFDYPAAANRADWYNLGGFSKVQPYYTRNCEVYALRDEVKPFIRSYFNSIAALINPEVLTFWEHFHHSGAWDKTHETGYFLHQTRTMLVQERGEDLWLAPFITSKWLEDGQGVTVRKAPTRFGTVAYEIIPHPQANYVEARIEPPARQLPKQIVLRLRHPEGKPMRSVAVNGKKIRTFDPVHETVAIRPSHGELTVRAEY